MKSIDKRITKEIFNKMVGKRLNYIMHDPFIYSNSVYGIVGLNIEDEYFKVSNQIEVEDFFGAKEDVARFDVIKDQKENIHSYVDGVNMSATPINQLIKGILVVNEHQQLFEDEQQTYDVWITRGFIIELADGLEISLEKEIWFSEEINIERGYNLIDKFSPISRVTEGWSSPKKMVCEREILYI